MTSRKIGSTVGIVLLPGVVAACIVILGYSVSTIHLHVPIMHLIAYGIAILLAPAAFAAIILSTRELLAKRTRAGILLIVICQGVVGAAIWIASVLFLFL